MNQYLLSTSHRRLYCSPHLIALACLFVCWLFGFDTDKTFASHPPAQTKKKTDKHSHEADKPLPPRVRRLAKQAQHDRDFDQVTPDHDRVRLADAYRQGVEDGRLSSQLSIQAQLGRSTYYTAMQQGQVAFVKGDYGVAVRHFILAEELDQGDPTARLFGCHARTALGHYVDAAMTLRRAFELEPRLAYLPMDIRNTYADPNELARHIGALHLAAQQNATDARLWFLLGYYHFYTGEMADAASVLDRARRLAPNDRVIGQFAEVARQSVRAGGAAVPLQYPAAQNQRPHLDSHGQKPTHAHQQSKIHWRKPTQ